MEQTVNKTMQGKEEMAGRTKDAKVGGRKGDNNVVPERYKLGIHFYELASIIFLCEGLQQSLQR